MDTKIIPVDAYTYVNSIDINGSGSIIEVKVTPPSDMATPLMFTVVPYVVRGSSKYGPVNMLPWDETGNMSSYIKTARFDSNSYIERLYKVIVSDVSPNGLTCTIDVNADDPIFNDAYVCILGLK